VSWTCPHCDRTFGTKRGHVCAPGLPIAYWLDEQPEGHRRAAEAVLAVARAIDGLVVEAVTVGVFIKRERSIVELRPKTKWLRLSFVTEARIASDRISRTAEWSGRHAYFVRLHDASDVDRELRGWLTEALRDPTRPPATRGARRSRAPRR
jgi:hypothetical protein